MCDCRINKGEVDADESADSDDVGASADRADVGASADSDDVGASADSEDVGARAESDEIGAAGVSTATVAVISVSACLRFRTDAVSSLSSTASLRFARCTLVCDCDCD